MEQQQLDQFSPKKKWYVYFIDFIMLFVAVTLGFLAENVRDQQTDKNREISYLKNVHDDLLVDINRIESVISSNNWRLLMLDSLHIEINKASPDLPSLYYYIRNLALRTTFESSHLGLDQIKASGGFRLIQNAKIIAGIQDYERKLNNAMKLEEARERTLEQAKFKMAVVFDAGTLYQMTKNQSMFKGEKMEVRFKRPAYAASFVVGDRETFNELINYVNIGLNTNLYLNYRYNELKSIAKALDAAIMEEYGNQFVD
ncbi:hypothetical protein LBMAG24_24530 [Bacteroidota bacterium]|nr:hypothetical protein LBMAG24_24530 [Bacteroidota bacterium]